jgi:hypothetical protein
VKLFSIIDLGSISSLSDGTQVQTARKVSASKGFLDRELYHNSATRTYRMQSSYDYEHELDTARRWHAASA